MANLFCKQAAKYAETRPSYPLDLFKFIASKTSRHDLAWDVGTGSGQAAVSLAQFYKSIVGTDTSSEQLVFATKIPNIRYQNTPPLMSNEELDRYVSPPATVDLVTVAQALHWFDLPKFYAGVKHVLRKPGGVFAAWCYTEPVVDETFDKVFWDLYRASAPYWADRRQWVDDEYRNVDFPFEPVDGEDHTGPFEFAMEKVMGLETFLMYIRSWSAYGTAAEKGVELLPENVVGDFVRAWGRDRTEERVVKFPIHLRIGRVI